MPCDPSNVFAVAREYNGEKFCKDVKSVYLNIVSERFRDYDTERMLGSNYNSFVGRLFSLVGFAFSKNEKHAAVHSVITAIQNYQAGETGNKIVIEDTHKDALNNGRLAKIFKSLELAEVEIEFKPNACSEAPTQRA